MPPSPWPFNDPRVINPPVTHGNAGTPTLTGVSDITISEQYGFTITHVDIKVVTSAGAGNRRIALVIFLGANPIFKMPFSVNVPASTTAVHVTRTNPYEADSGEAIGASQFVYKAFAPVHVPNGCVVGARDIANTDAANDTFELSLIGTPITLI
jgi:hypothetical protein